MLFNGLNVWCTSFFFVIKPFLATATIDWLNDQMQSILSLCLAPVKVCTRAFFSPYYFVRNLKEILHILKKGQHAEQIVFIAPSKSFVVAHRFCWAVIFLHEHYKKKCAHMLFMAWRSFFFSTLWNSWPRITLIIVRCLQSVRAKWKYLFRERTKVQPQNEKKNADQNVYWSVRVEVAISLSLVSHSSRG